IVFYFNFHYVLYSPRLIQSSTPALEARATETYLSEQTGNVIVVIAVSRTDYNKFLFWQTRNSLQFIQKDSLNQKMLDTLSSKYDKVVVLPSVSLTDATSPVTQFGSIKIFD
ncbi:MAG: hypothetical protein RIS09_385, partial [Actinomycetota bacterium]